MRKMICEQCNKQYQMDITPNYYIQGKKVCQDCFDDSNDFCCDVFKKMLEDHEILFMWGPDPKYKFGYFDSYNDYPIHYCPNCGVKIQ